MERPHIERTDGSRLRLQQVIDDPADDRPAGSIDGPPARPRRADRP